MMLPMSLHPKNSSESGFSLIEIAIGLVIIGLLLGGILAPLSSQHDQRRIKNTDTVLDEVYNALLGYAALNGRLPCPATTGSNGLPNPNNATVSCNQEHGFLPARELGLNGSYNNNLLVDAWNNPIRYSLTDFNSGTFSSSISTTSIAGDYRVCSDTPCTAANTLAENLVLVVCSTGKNGALPTNSPLQRENTDNDTDFVKAEYSEAVNREFDDLCRWISPNIIALQLLRAGNL